MAQTVNYIVARTSPNLYAAAKQANLNQTQVNQIEQFSWTTDKNKRLLRMPVEKAREQYNSLDKEVQEMLKFLYPDAEYAKAAPDTGDKILSLVKGGLKVAASPLIGIYKAAGVYGRAINLPYLVGRQVAQGEDLFSKQVLTDAWDGRRVFDEAALADVERTFDKNLVEIAKGLIQGKKPGEIIESQGTLSQDFLNSFAKAFNDDPQFKQVMDAVKYAQVSPGRDLARVLNKPVPAKSGTYISGKTKNISGFVDFMYQIVVDPLTWLTGGASKIPALLGKVNVGDQMVRNIEQFGTLGVKKSFEESPQLRNHWDKEIGPMIKNLSEAKNLAEESKIMSAIGKKYAGHESTEWLQMLKRNRIFNAESAVDYFGNKTDAAINLLAGRVEGTQYFRNGVATARNQRRLDFGMGRFVDGIFNPQMASEDVLAKGEDVWTKLNKLGDEGTNFVSPEVEDLQKFVNKMTLTEKIGQKFARSPQGRAISIGKDAIKTADNFRDTARQILPRDLADFVTLKFINADTNDQVAVVRSLYYAIMQRYGIDGHPKGKEIIEEELKSHFGSKEGLAITEKLEVPEQFLSDLGKTGLKLSDEGAFYDSAGIIHPFQEAKSISNLNYIHLAQLSYEAKTKSSVIMAVGKGAGQSKFASDMVNAWTILTLFPRLGVRSAIDEGVMYILTAPIRDIWNSILPRYAAKGRDAGKIAATVTASKSGEGFRESIKGAIGLTRGSEKISLTDRLILRANIAKRKNVSEEQVTQMELISDTTNVAARMFPSRLDNDELDDIKDALVHNQHLTKGMAGSLAARASGSGGYATEIAEQLVDFNNYEAFLKAADQASGLKGSVIDTRDLERSELFGRNAVAAVHFENWVRRFYGNRRTVKGYDEGRNVSTVYNFNPTQAFFESNGLKTSDDFVKARDMLLADIGIIRNGKIIDEIGEAAAEVSPRYTYAVKDNTALADFLQMSARTSALRQKGFSDLDIARDQVERILLDMYATFHGSSKKFNESLLQRLGSSVKEYKAQEVSENITVKNKWNLAAQSLKFDEFVDLTKGYQPSGKMYTMLDIEGITDVESAFAKLGNNMMEIMDRQVTGLLRQPAVMTAYLRIRKNYRKFQQQDIREMNNRQIASLENEGINPNTVKYVKADGTKVTWADDILEDVKEITARKYAEIAMMQAADTVLKFADNPNVRTNFAISVRNVGRFYRATEDFWRRVYRLKDVSPRVLYRMRLAHTGIDASGDVYEDANGDAYVMMPMDDVIFKTVENVTRTLGGNTAFQQPLFNDVTLKLKLANPSFSPDAGMPTLSGPIAALGVIGMKHLLGATGVAGKKIGEEVDNYALGSIGEGIDIVRALVPAPLQRIYSALSIGEKNRQEATAAMQAIAFNAAYGNIPKATDTAEEKYQYLKNIRISAHNIMIMRSVLGLVSPITPTMQESKGIPDYLKQVGITGLRPEFYDLVNAITKKYGGDIQDPYDLAVSTFVGKNPGKIIYTVSRDEKQTNVVIQKTKEMKDWYISNKSLIDKYGEASFIFAPQTGEFDAASYAWLEAADFIKNKDLEKYYMDVMLSQDKQTYFGIARDESEALSSTVSPSARRAIIENATKQRQAMKFANPLLEVAITGGGNEVASESAMFQNIENILQDASVNIAPATRAKMMIIASQVRDFISLSTDPESREAKNFSEIKRQRKAEIEGLIADFIEADLTIKEANRAVFQTILDYYSRDTYRV